MILSSNGTKPGRLSDPCGFVALDLEFLGFVNTCFSFFSFTSSI